MALVSAFSELARGSVHACATWVVTLTCCHAGWSCPSVLSGLPVRLTAHQVPDREQRVQQWAAFNKLFSEECASNGLSLVCVDHVDGRDVVAGCMWMRDFAAPLPANFEAVLTSGQCDTVARLINILEELDNKYLAQRKAQGHPDLKPGEACDLWMCGVRPDYRRRGICGELIRRSIAHAHASGFHLAVGECTGAFSLRGCDRAGMKQVCEVSYTEAKEQLFRSTPPPHRAMVFVEHVDEASTALATAVEGSSEGDGDGEEAKATAKCGADAAATPSSRGDSAACSVCAHKQSIATAAVVGVIGVALFMFLKRRR